MLGSGLGPKVVVKRVEKENVFCSLCGEFMAAVPVKKDRITPICTDCQDVWCSNLEIEED